MEGVLKYIQSVDKQLEESTKQTEIRNEKPRELQKESSTKETSSQERRT